MKKYVIKSQDTKPVEISALDFMYAEASKSFYFHGEDGRVVAVFPADKIQGIIEKDSMLSN